MKWWPWVWGPRTRWPAAGVITALAKALGGPDLPAIGFAIGEDRLLEVLPQDLGQDHQPRVFVAALGEPARDRAFTLIEELRRKNLAGEMDFDGRSLKAQMTLADRLNATYAVILGDQELETGAAQVRPMRKLAVPRRRRPGPGWSRSRCPLRAWWII